MLWTIFPLLLFISLLAVNSTILRTLFLLLSLIFFFWERRFNHFQCWVSYYGFAIGKFNYPLHHLLSSLKILFIGTFYILSHLIIFLLLSPTFILDPASNAYQQPSLLFYICRWTWVFVLLITFLHPSHLYLSNNFNLPLNHLPLSLLHLGLGGSYNTPIDKLPPSLLCLRVGNDFNPICLLLSLLSILTTVSFKTDFNQPLHSFPPSLRRLKFGKEFTQPLDHLPSSLTCLNFNGSKFNLPLILPTSLTHLLFKLTILPLHYITIHLISLPLSLI